jgi:hypothetical protein
MAPPSRQEQRERARRRQRRRPRANRRQPRRRPDPASLNEDPKPDAFVLAGKKLSHYIGLIVTDGEIETTIEGASTLTLNLREQDGEVRKLIAHRVFEPVKKKRGKRPKRSKQRKGDGKEQDARRPKTEPKEEDLPPRLADGTRMVAAGLTWELVAISKQGDQYTFTFEDWAVSQLRRLNEPKKIRRDKATRAEFIKSITIDELKRPKIKFVCPDLHEVIKPGRKSAQDEDDRDERRQRGIAKQKKLDFRGKRATQRQKDNAEDAMERCDRANAGERSMMAVAMAGINETAFRKKLDPDDIRKAIAFARTYEKQSSAEICRAIWGKRKGALATWKRWSKEASELVEAYGGPARRKPKLRDKDD